MVIEEDRQPSPSDAGVKFTLRSLRIDGATVFSESELLSPYTGYYNQVISFDTLNSITAELTKKYRDSGYILSRVVLPAQDVDQRAADIRLLAVEGYLTDIQYEGEAKLVASFKKRFAKVERKLLGKRPLRHLDFEREMLLLQDTPGIKVSSRFQEASINSGSILILEIRRDPVSGSLGWGNTGTESAGPGLISASLSLDSLPALGQSTTLSYTQADNLREYYSLSISEAYQFANGLVLRASYSHSDSMDPDTDFARLFDYSTQSDTVYLSASYPFIRSRDMNLSFTAAYEHRDSYSDLLGSGFNRDRLRNASLSANFDFSDELGGLTQLVATITQGLGVFNATNENPLATNSLAQSQYFKFDFYFSRNQRLPANFSFLLAGELMVSDKILTSYNKFSYGGGQFGRGYDSGTIEGDNGVAFSFEPRWTHYFGDSVALQPFAFIDYGYVWDNQRVFGIPAHQYGSSVGAGLRLLGHGGNDNVPDFNLSAYWGERLNKIGEEKSSRYVFQATFFF
jgi:hemolysin activation/secretion protein